MWIHTSLWALQKREIDVIPNVNFSLSSNNNNKPGELFNNINEKLITAINNITRFSRHGQVCLIRFRFERCYKNVYKNALRWSHSSKDTKARENYRPDDERSISRNVASSNILVYDVMNLLCYEHWKDKWK